MKKNIIILIVFAFLKIYCWPITANSNTQTSNDRVILYTDRTLYAADETIFFAAKVQNPSGEISKVLYIELITPQGNSLVSGKYLISNQTVNGSISIPANIISGIYYLKAYTRWMRNFSVKDYFIQPVKIVNPHREDFIGKNGTNNNNGYKLAENESHSKIYSITTDHSIYSTRQKGTITINNELNKSKLNWACLSIAPIATTKQLEINQSAISELPESSGTQPYLPDKDGFILSGRLLDKNTQKPLQYVQVNLSILGSNPDFIAKRADSAGYFFFNLPYMVGKNDFYIGVKESANALVKIDNDFCTRSINLPELPFSLTEDERIAIENISKNLLVSNFFKPTIDTTLVDSIITKPVKPFYGNPDMNLLIDKYIDLLSIEEYFHELVFNVGVKTKGNNKFFYIHGNHSELQIYDPLVLIDHVAVSEAQRMLSVQPRLLSHIEIITKPYYKGNKVFGGIISFFSKNNDLAGIELPPSDMFLELELLSIHSPYKSASKTLSNLPDARNTVLWIDSILKSNEHPILIDFITPDTPGKYKIIFRGVDSNNEPFSVYDTITIK